MSGRTGVLAALVLGTGQLGIMEDWVAPRYISALGIDKRVAPRYTLTTLERRVAPRYISALGIDARRAPRYASMAATYEAAWSLGTAGALAKTFTAYNAGSTRDLTVVGVTFRVTLREGLPADWTLTIPDPLGWYHPDSTVGTPSWEGWLSDDPYNASSAYVRRLLVSVTWGGMPWYFVGIPERVGYRMGADQRHELVWSGSDVTKILHRPNQNMATARSTGASIQQRYALMQAIATNYGVVLNTTGLDRDHPIPIMNRQKGAPMEWITALLETLWDTWTVEGEQVMAYRPLQKPVSTADWEVDLSSELVEEITEDRTFAGGVSQVIMRRAREQSNVLASADGTTFGQGTVSFSRVGYGITVRHGRESNGYFSDFVYRNAGGTVIAVREARNPSLYPTSLQTNGPVDGASSCTYTFGAAPGYVGGEGSGSVEWLALPENPIETGIEDDGVYSVTESSTAYQTDPDARQVEFEMNPLIPSGEILTLSAQRYLARQGRKRRERRFQLFFLHPQLRIGQTIRLVNGLHGAANVALLVTEITHNLGPGTGPDHNRTAFAAVQYA